MPEFTKEYLAELQALPLEVKIAKSKLRIREWYHHFGGKVYVSFSGGKDSTVLLHLVRSIFPDVPAVFSDTGLEYPEIKAFAKSYDKVDVVRPKMVFDQVVQKYGYPLVSKEIAKCIFYARKNIRTSGVNNFRLRLLDKAKYKDTLSRFNIGKWLPLAQKAPFLIGADCCATMKKSPIHKYECESDNKPFIGTLANESKMREQAWKKHGCNSFDCKKQSSQPLSFWTEQDVLAYIENNNLPICSVYGDIIWTDNGDQLAMPNTPGAKRITTGAYRTGCVFCGFGMHLEKGESRFQRLRRTHLKLYDYAIGGGQWIDNPDYIEGLSTEPDEMGWIPWNPEKIWVPSKKGLGMGFVFDEGNRIYGKEVWRYK